MNGEKGTIIIFSTAYLPFLGGAETAIKGITENIDKYRFILLTSRFKKSLPRSEVTGQLIIYRLGIGSPVDKYLLPILSFLKFIRIRKKLERPVFFWGIMASYGSIGALFLKLFFRKIPFLLTVQEGDSEEHMKKSKFGLVDVFFQILVRHADRIQVISSYLKDLCLRKGARVQIDVVPNGVDLEKFSNPNPRPFGGKKIISVSRRVYKNGLDILEKAFDTIKKRYPDAELKIVSDMPYDGIPTLLWNSDVFIRPSRSEGLGTAFLEAMAAGLPIIATRVGGIKDFLDNKVTGLEVKPEDADDLASRIEVLFSDENLRNKLVENGSKLVREKYQWPMIARDMEKIFDSMI